ncbi:MAG: ROK family protein [Chitinophagaceae bacterium]
MPTKHLAIGADIGGTHITAAVVDLQKRSIIPGTETRAKVNAHASVEEIVESWSDAINKTKGNFDITSIGLAIPGPFDYEAGICLIKNQDKYETLYKRNVKELLSEKLVLKPENIKLINDAAAFLDGEVFCGAATGCHKAVGITLGTGLGSCIHENGSSTDADLWQMPFRNGIAEDYLCTRWFTRRFEEISGEKTCGVSEIITKLEDNAHVQPLFTEFGISLGEFLLEFLALSNTEIIVIGGNISKSFSLFEKTLMETIHRKNPSVQVKIARLGEEAALLGAASHTMLSSPERVQE